ncbi:unnamed protein product [Acanthoscelides obtectus]|uniref:Uncharacterized protein n=1 Tax=Acanthoscelides obtectus TaxID=200917 RepID=A0A9P0P6K1_ACAOB|nr:unnamed protein product [Acanthoscelides obtectus]CAK1633173.1 hypothetical protein AOBTE_LOCUS7979 [Acanthoscelides obtectus]
MSGVLCKAGLGDGGRALRNLLFTFVLCYWTVVLVLADTNGRLTPNSVLAKIWCKIIPYFLKLLSQFGDCTSRIRCSGVVGGL